MTSWPPRDIAVWRAPAVERTPFERSVKPRPDAPVPEPPGIAQQFMPPPGVPVLWCRCGAAIEVGASRPQSTQLEREYHEGFLEQHSGLGHRVVRDDYRAPCRPFAVGCRQCGEPPTGGKRFYCSDHCRDVFDRDHFWHTASGAAITRQSVYSIVAGPRRHREAVMCARCWDPIEGTPEVNHIVPVNGVRPTFGCQHHLANLEVVSHRCHLDITAEQRTAGLIGARGRPA